MESYGILWKQYSQELDQQCLRHIDTGHVSRGVILACPSKKKWGKQHTVKARKTEFDGDTRALFGLGCTRRSAIEVINNGMQSLCRNIINGKKATSQTIGYKSTPVHTRI